MDKKRILEWGKTLLILLLTVSAVYLSYRVGYSSVLDERIDLSAADSGKTGASAEGDSTSESLRGIRVLKVAVNFGGSQRGGWAYDDEEVNSVFRRFSAPLGEALGSAGEPVEVTEQRFREAQETPGVFLRLVCAQPMELLSARLGTEMSSAAAADRTEMLYLCAEGDTVALYYRLAGGGLFRCDTALTSAALQSRIDELQPNGAYFAYESDELSGLDPYTLILDTIPPVYTVTGDSFVPDDTATESLFALLGINSYVASPYTESGGTKVYIDENRTLRISPSGSVSFHQEGGEYLRLERDSAGDAIELGRELVESALEPWSGDAEVCLSGWTGGDGDYVLYFDYIVNGVPVELRASHAAYIKIEDGNLVSASFVFRRYTLEEEEETVLSMLLAGAIVSSGESEGLELVYLHSGETVSCTWVTD